MHEPQDIIEINCVVNGQKVHARVGARQHLADFLREQLELKGTHIGCEHGACGACTVILDDGPVRGCLVLAAQVDGKKIETIEGAVQSGRVDALIQAFHKRNAGQCGFCSPAMVLTTAELLTHNPSPSREEVREHISGNYCRCTGYQSIVDAVMDVAAARNAKKGPL